jgi:hypothetical protein
VVFAEIGHLAQVVGHDDVQYCLPVLRVEKDSAEISSEYTCTSKSLCCFGRPIMSENMLVQMLMPYRKIRNYM